MVKAKQQRKRNRKLLDRAVPVTPSFTNVVSVTAGSSAVTILFASPVNISPTNLPATWRFGTSARTITALTSTTGISYVFAVSGTVATGQVTSMPAGDPAARTNTGGYVQAFAGNLL